MSEQYGPYGPRGHGVLLTRYVGPDYARWKTQVTIEDGTDYAALDRVDAIRLFTQLGKLIERCDKEGKPRDPTRTKSGVLRIGEDWPGVFIRGDHAFGIAMGLECLADELAGEGEVDPELMVPMLRDLVTELRRCQMIGGREPEDTQHAFRVLDVDYEADAD